ncbi:hypothetical protein [Dickeya solani]|uniref:Uncharacterized protein n=1 Tax=Dickeya solani TaxID=1089444 RepID=A0ABU4EID1_9GAMM|nr:hypothetical protein [Dickeya solani]MCA7001513.1 hypothetical protein [Dickeya solani]MCZ0820843.1 hypothetical protein [Dickeya solani]MDV6996889.1 hypothetical protein [Dickeya solani]MDV7002639.1 hypothetical protein [Dickeya solani]MDV7038711.1 hypothetical protein [Dickeya solani]
MKAIIPATGFIKPYADFTGGITSDTALIAGENEAVNKQPYCLFAGDFMQNW